MKFITKRTTTIAAVVVVIAIIVGFTARNQRAAANDFFSATVEKGPLKNVVNATGVLQTVVTVQVGSQVSAQVQELYADFNSIVKRGQLLAKLDPRNFQAQVQNSEATVAAARARVQSAEADIHTNDANMASSKANLEAAKVTRDTNLVLFDRAKGLLAKGLTPQNDYDTAKSNYDSAEAKYQQAKAAIDQVQAQGASLVAQLEQTKALMKQAEADLERARLNLGYCDIYSPVDGVVISRSVDVGQTIAASLQAPTLFSIANDLSQMQVNASVDEADIGNISAAEDVRFTVDAYPNDIFKAKISEIRLSPQTVQNVVTYSVILNIDNSDMKLRPGMTANITFTVDQRDSVAKLPNAALRYTPPGQTRPDPKEMLHEIGKPGSATQSASKIGVAAAGSSELEPTRLAPGQKWNPANKIRFLTPKKQVERPAIVWVLNAQKSPEMRRVVLGITDGVNSEILSGDVKQGDQVIVGDSTQAGGTGQSQRGFFFGPPGGGGGGGGRGGRGQ
jgi:HlyD family secretion protein